MVDKDYKIVERQIEDLDFKLLIIAIPDEEVEDKLAPLAREHGQITKNFYEEFIISICIANVHQLLHCMGNLMHMPSNIKIESIRRKIYEFILEASPLFSPKHIYINKNGVLKTTKDTNKKLRKDELWLVNNKLWNYEEKEEEKTATAPPPPPDEIVKKVEKKERLPASELKPVESLKVEYIKKWWNRLGQYVVVKQYNQEDAEHILRSATVRSRTAFNSYIVNICVVDVKEVYDYLDSIGLPSKIAPPILMHELYDLCRQANPFLTFDEARAWMDEEDIKEMQTEEGTKKKKKTGSSSMTDYAKETKQRKKFSDVSKNKLLGLGNKIKNQLIGQDAAVDTVVEAIQRASVGLKDPNKPIGSFLFAGATGCGKTLTSKVLAEELTEEPDSLIVVDCSEYSAEHEYAKLIGAPAGYIGYENGGFLTNAITKNPFSVVVFDEVEKANYKVHELLLQVLDEGRLTDGKGCQVSFKDAIVILTSNIGAKEVDNIKNTVGFGDVATITDKKKDTEITKAIKNKFKPEFINRIDSIVYFRKLIHDDYMKIIDIELNKLNKYLKSNKTNYSGILLEFDDKVRELIYKEGIDEDYGARPLKRCIEKVISTPLALKILREDIGGSIIKVSTSKDSAVIFDVKKDTAPKTCECNEESE